MPKCKKSNVRTFRFISDREIMHVLRRLREFGFIK